MVEGGCPGSLSFPGSFGGGQSQTVSLEHTVDRPLTSRQMCQKASQSLGENLQVLEGKGRQTQLQVSESFPDRG